MHTHTRCGGASGNQRTHSTARFHAPTRREQHFFESATNMFPQPLPQPFSEHSALRARSSSSRCLFFRHSTPHSKPITADWNFKHVVPLPPSQRLIWMASTNGIARRNARQVELIVQVHSPRQRVFLCSVQKNDLGAAGLHLTTYLSAKPQRLCKFAGERICASFWLMQNDWCE